MVKGGFSINKGAAFLTGVVIGFITFIFVMLMAASSLLIGVVTLVVMAGLSAGAVHRHPRAGGYLSFYLLGFVIGFAANLAIFLLVW